MTVASLSARPFRVQCSYVSAIIFLLNFFFNLRYSKTSICSDNRGMTISWVKRVNVMKIVSRITDMLVKVS